MNYSLEEADKAMRIGITGTQNGMSEEQFSSLSTLIEKLPMSEMHGGDCIGFDAECILLVREIRPDVKTIGHPPDNNNKRAFLDYDEECEAKPYRNRNQDIVDSADFMIACPNSYKEKFRGSGTWMTIRMARKANKQLVIIWPDGTLSE